MAYERDKDRSTRGVGAIAALDRASGRRHRRRVDGARATITRDQKMAAIAGGALGRVDLRDRRLDPFGTGTGTGSPKKILTNPFRPTPTVTTAAPFIPLIAPPATLSDPGRSPVEITIPRETGDSRVPAITPPALIKPGGTESPPIIGGGGGKTGILIAPPAPIQIDLPPPAPDDDVLPDQGGGSSSKTLWIVGGLALGAYLLFGGKRP